MHNKFLVTILATVLLFSVGCKKESTTAPTEEPPVSAPPSFNIASTLANCTGTNDCIEFFATPNKDVILVKVVIKYPVTGSITYNLGSSTVISDESIALQAAGTAYNRISGTWRFTFTGSLAGEDQSSFTVATSVNVGAKLKN